MYTCVCTHCLVRQELRFAACNDVNKVHLVPCTEEEGKEGVGERAIVACCVEVRLWETYRSGEATSWNRGRIPAGGTKKESDEPQPPKSVPADSQTPAE